MTRVSPQQVERAKRARDCFSQTQQFGRPRWMFRVLIPVRLNYPTASIRTTDLSTRLPSLTVAGVLEGEGVAPGLTRCELRCLNPVDSAFAARSGFAATARCIDAADIAGPASPCAPAFVNRCGRDAKYLDGDRGDKGDINGRTQGRWVKALPEPPIEPGNRYQPLITAEPEKKSI